MRNFYYLLRHQLRYRFYSFNFWFKTILYRWTPGGYGYYRDLRSLKDPKAFTLHPVRQKHNQKGGWQSGRNVQGLRYRDYENYDEYLVHQQQKFTGIIKRQGGFDNSIVALYRKRFYQRFRYLLKILPRQAVIVCAGARQGTEVEVLRDLGFKNAYGIDLNPGPNNRLVRVGDFMRMDNPSDSIDLLYTNCVDHAFELDAFFAEHARVIRPEGFALYDLFLGQEGGAFEALDWDSENQIFFLILRYFKQVIRVERQADTLWILVRQPHKESSSTH